MEQSRHRATRRDEAQPAACHPYLSRIELAHPPLACADEKISVPHKLREQARRVLAPRGLPLRKSGLEPEAFARGSIMSKIGPARQLSPGRMISKSAPVTESSSRTIRRSSSGSTASAVSSNCVAVLNRISVIG